MSLLNEKEECIGIKKEIIQLQQDVDFIQSIITTWHIDFTHWNKILLTKLNRIDTLKKEMEVNDGKS